MTMMPMIPGNAERRLDMPMTPAEKGRNRFDAAAEGKQRKEEANYRVATGRDRCADCRHFDGEQSCAKVAGRIAPDGVSDLFERAEREKVPDQTKSVPLEDEDEE